MPRPISRELGTPEHLSALYDRVARLERRRALHNVPFSYPGVLTVSTSPPWTPNSECRLIEVRALLGTTGTSNTVVTIYVNGSSVGTVTLGSGVANNSATLSTALTANTDVVTVGITTVGTSAANLTVLARVV